MVSPVVTSPSGSASIAPASTDHKTKQSSEVSIRLWPPGPQTRSHVAKRMADNLKSLCAYYQSLEPEEAAGMATLVEERAFEEGQKEDLESGEKSNGSSAVRVYAKQASRMMLEVLKTGKLPESEMTSSKEETPDVQNVGDVKLSSDASVDAAPDTDTQLFDISGGERLVLDSEKVEEVFAPLADPACSFTKVRLSNWAFTKDAAQYAGNLLVKLKDKLVSADLSDIVAGRPEPEALEVMSIFSAALEGATLSCLDLSNNALGEKGLRAFSVLLKAQKHLTELHFENNGISADAAKAIVELVSGSKLRVLHFHNNMTGDTGAERLSKLISQATVLEDLKLSSSRVGTKGAIALSSAIKECSNLRKLDLRDNMFEPEAAPAVAEALKHKLALEELYLADLGLQESGVRHVLEALAESAPSLSVLDLGNNEITVSCASDIAKFLEKKPTLKKLGLQENELGDKGVILVSKALRENHDALEEVDFTLNDVGSEGAIAAAKAVASKPGFKKLILESNHISAKGLAKVKEVFASGVGTSALVPLEDNEEVEDEDELELEDEDAGKEEIGDSEELQNKVDALSI